MIWYFLGISLHILSAFVWMGLLVYRLAVANSLPPPSAAGEAARSGGPAVLERLGVPSLLVIVATGVFLLYYRGVTLHDVSSGRLFVGSSGELLRLKLWLTAGLLLVYLLPMSRSRMRQWALAGIGCIIIAVSAILIR